MDAAGPPAALSKCVGKVPKWHTRGRQAFPNLEVLARTYLAMPASTARLERLFSPVRSAACGYQRNSLQRDRFVTVRTNGILRAAAQGIEGCPEEMEDVEEEEEEEEEEAGLG